MNRAKVLIFSTLVIGITIGVGTVALSPQPGTTMDASAAMGRWLTESGNLEIEIAPCGGAVCGTVVAVRANRSMSHPDQEMTPVDSRSPMGMRILSGFVEGQDGSWAGRIYNRENGKTYDCLMTPISADKLRVRGYKLVPLLGKNQVWTRIANVQTAAGAR
jgi:uncharacterized protein (DUF2147 family)